MLFNHSLFQEVRFGRSDRKLFCVEHLKLLQENIIRQFENIKAF